jgi:hypothetical protein
LEGILETLVASHDQNLLVEFGVEKRTVIFASIWLEGKTSKLRFHDISQFSHVKSVNNVFFEDLRMVQASTFVHVLALFNTLLSKHILSHFICAGGRSFFQSPLLQYIE